MLKLNLWLPILLSLSFFGCAKSSDEALYAPTAPSSPNSPQSCSLEGQWHRCSDDGGGVSTELNLSISSGTMNETIKNYNTSTDCSGTPANQMEIHGTVVVGTLGASSAIAGGTDVDLTANLDIFGCGADKPAYTVISLDRNSCEKFYFSSSAPSCDPAARGNAFETQPFLRQ